MKTPLRQFLLGHPLPTAATVHERLSNVKALAVFSSDALSSVAYATEEILLVLVLAGPAILGLSLPIAVVITGLIAIVALSYYQTIHGYPNGGGAYTVAHENLGRWPGLIAAAALLIDYVLTVAVSTTAGVRAITSAIPELLPWHLTLCLVGITLITWANLRGVRESGTVFALPTYGFVGLMLFLLAVGGVRWLSGTLPPEAAPPGSAVAPHALTLLLLLRAFASGCTALTGIEAISNGIPAFRQPEASNAGKTLLVMAVLLTTLFLGVTVLAHTLGVVPQEHESVVSQIGRHVFGPGPLYGALQAMTALILLLAANTSFADFPRLSAILARDRFMPRQLLHLGDRLVFSNGIVVLALLAALLVMGFGGETHRLIPLYAVGVFLAFTLSQAGMVRHWRRDHGPHWYWKAGINGLGAVTTGVVLLVIVESKFLHGAWLILVLIPLVSWGCATMQRHYTQLRRQLALDRVGPEPWPDRATTRTYKVVVPISGVNRCSLAALRFARSLSQDVTAVLVEVEPKTAFGVRNQWTALGADIPLVVLESPYRSVVQPLLAYLDTVDQRDPARGVAVVVLPEFVPGRWWHHLLHNQTALLLKTVLIYRRARTGTDRVIIDVPYHLPKVPATA